MFKLLEACFGWRFGVLLDILRDPCGTVRRSREALASERRGAPRTVSVVILSSRWRLHPLSTRRLMASLHRESSPIERTTSRSAA